MDPRWARSPRVTVYTAGPVGGPLEPSWQSLLAQDFDDWEWVVALGERPWQPAPDDGRVRVLVDNGVRRVAPAKALACSAALGEILVELDAGDRLAPGSLSSLVRAFDTDPAVGFVYSDFAPASDGLDPVDGWTFRPEKVAGDRPVPRWMAPTPHNVSYTAYAPTHVRAFRRSVYQEAGGFEAGGDISLCEHDLVCRLYQRAEFRHLPDCLYLEEHARGPDAEERHRGSADHYHRHVQPNALAWSRRRGLAALDLSPGAAFPGYRQASVDSIADLGLPESSVGIVRAVDVLHSVADRELLWTEIHRLLAHGGMVVSLTPAGPDLKETTFWELARREAPRFQLSWLSTEPGEHPGAPYVCANLIAIKDGARQGGLLDG